MEEDVVDADHAFLAQHDVVGEGGALVHRHPEAEMRVVIEIRPRRDDPVEESRLDERDDRGHAEPGGRHRPGEAHPDRHVVREHALREQPAPFGQPPGVVGEKSVLHQLGSRLLAGCGGAHTA